MASRWGHKSTGWDQPLPWPEDVGSAVPSGEQGGPEEAEEPHGPHALGERVAGCQAGEDDSEAQAAAVEVDLTDAEQEGRPAGHRRRRSAKSGLTPEQRRLQARAAAYRLHATHDPKETTKKARAAFSSRFEREVDPDMVLPAAERARRAEAAKQAYFTSLALRSSRARGR